jgi:hypothetical protein
MIQLLLKGYGSSHLPEGLTIRSSRPVFSACRQCAADRERTPLPDSDDSIKPADLFADAVGAQ